MLLKERTRTHSINIRLFYKRRFFRIYPVYIFCITLSYSFYLFPSLRKIIDPSAEHNYLTPGQEYLIMAMLGSHILFSLKENALALHTLTVVAEENFYLIWAPVLKLIKGFYWIVPVLCISPAIELILSFINRSHSSHWISFFLNFNNYFRISTIAIGALGCYVYLYRKPWITFCRNRWIQYAALLLLLFFFTSGVRFGIIYYEFIGAVFLIIVLGNIEESGNPLQFEYKPFKFIGRISYGMYVFHPLSILVCMLALQPLKATLWIYLPLLIILSFALTLLVSTIVYYSFERRLYERSSTLLKN
jgi:peptidoglycan/LPS O-acetylase OafA/YrhL